MNALGRLWEEMDGDLQAALVGAYVKHSIISTRKAVAAIGGMDANCGTLLCKMADWGTEVPSPIGDQGSYPASESMVKELVRTGRHRSMKCSPCVLNAARHCWRSRRETHMGEEEVPVSDRKDGEQEHALLWPPRSDRPMVTCEQFLLVLAETSCGPTVQQWREDGVTHVRMRAEIANIKTAGFSRESQADDGDSDTRVTEARTSTAVSMRTDEEESGLCNICFDAPIDCVLVPCGHRGFCRSCCKPLASCPICRANITLVVKTFDV